MPTPISTAQTTFTNTPTISGSAYSAGFLLGGKQTITNAARAGKNSDETVSGLIQQVLLFDIGDEGVQVDVVFFDADPTGTTFTERSALIVADADLTKIVGVVSLVTRVSFNDNGLLYARNLSIPFKCTTNNVLYAAMVARGTVTYDSISALTLRVQILQD